MVLFYEILKKYNEIQLTKNKMDSNDQKITITKRPIIVTVGHDILLHQSETVWL